MEASYTPEFALDIQGIKGSCPAGEAYGRQQIIVGLASNMELSQ
jgi:hypothetical protein